MAFTNDGVEKSNPVDKQEANVANCRKGHVIVVVVALQRLLFCSQAKPFGKMFEKLLNLHKALQSPVKCYDCLFIPGG